MLIVISSEKYRPDEIQNLHQLFGAGLLYFHLRKPNFSEQKYRDYLLKIDLKYHNRIVIHEFHSLAEEFNLGGVHLRENFRYGLKDELSMYVSKFKDKLLTISTSFHASEDLNSCDVNFDYQFLSPVFDSISKKGYRGKNFDVNSVNKNIIALGGVSSKNIHLIKSKGFYGAAILGAIWEQENVLKAYRRIVTRFCMDKLYYISQGKTIMEHYANIKKVCENGVRLVQLRVKNYNKEELIEVAYSCKKVCEYYGVTLIINDHLWLAKELSLGLHLGKNDTGIREAKQQLNKQQLVGGTANTLEDCLSLIALGVDYIGLGPFRYTETKKNLSPILGIEAYEKIINVLKSKGHQIPIYAIGGITVGDFKPILESGVYGIAVSGLLTDIADSSIKVITEKFE